MSVVVGGNGILVDYHSSNREHFDHHAILNTIEPSIGVKDPQFAETFICHNEKAVPFIPEFVRLRLIPLQHIYTVPIALIVGHTAIMVDGFKAEVRPLEWLGIILHWTISISVWCLQEGWQNRLIFFIFTCFFEGILHIQLLVNHSHQPFALFTEVRDEIPFSLWNALVTLNIDNPAWMDWFHGGLNFHIEHHMFPRLPRYRLREISPLVKSLLKKHGVPYKSMTFLNAVYDMVLNFARVARNARKVSKEGIIYSYKGEKAQWLQF